MGEPRGDVDLTKEARRANSDGDLRLENLYSDGTMMLEVLGEEDRSHPPVTQLALESVPVGECRFEARQRVTVLFQHAGPPSATGLTWVVPGGNARGFFADSGVNVWRA